MVQAACVVGDDDYDPYLDKARVKFTSGFGILALETFECGGDCKRFLLSVSLHLKIFFFPFEQLDGNRIYEAGRT